MLSKLSTSLVLALVATSLANPIFTRGDAECPKELKSSDKDWCSGNGDDKIVIRVSDKWTDYGTVTPEKLIDSIKDKCGGGACDEFEWPLEAEWQDDDKEGSAVTGDVIVKVIDQVGMWRNFDKMIKALTTTIDKIKKTEEKTVWDYTNNGDSFSGTDRKITSTRGPAQIVFEELGESADNPPLTSVTLHFTKKEDPTGSKALCDGLMTAGSAVARAINPILGTGMGLASLACAFAEE